MIMNIQSTDPERLSIEEGTRRYAWIKQNRFYRWTVDGVDRNRRIKCEGQIGLREEM